MAEGTLRDLSNEPNRACWIGHRGLLTFPEACGHEPVNGIVATAISVTQAELDQRGPAFVLRCDGLPEGAWASHMQALHRIEDAISKRERERERERQREKKRGQSISAAGKRIFV